MVKCNVQVAGKDVSAQESTSAVQEDSTALFQSFQFIVVDETLNERVEQAEAMLFETMHKVLERRQNIDGSLSHALTKQLEEYSMHLHGEIKVKREGVVDENVNGLNEHSLGTLDVAVRGAKERLDALPAVLARLERARTVILDEEDRKKHGSHQGREGKAMSSKQRRVSKQFDLANKLSLY